MGHDIVPIARHSLNTKNVETLARDLFARLEVNIRYGYQAWEHHTRLLGDTFDDFEYVTLGFLEKDKKLPTFRLTHNEHQSKAVVEKYGMDIIYDPRYHPSQEPPEKYAIDRALRELQFNSYDFDLEDPIDEDNNGIEGLYIYDHLYADHMDYFSRWWYLCRVFTNAEELYYPENLLHFRKTMLKNAAILGGDKSYYLDDQSDVMEGVGQSEEAEMTWPEFESFVIEKSGDLLLDIPRYFKDPAYKEMWDTRHTYPLAFVDDFSDLELKRDNPSYIG